MSLVQEVSSSHFDVKIPGQRSMCESSCAGSSYDNDPKLMKSKHKSQRLAEAHYVPRVPMMGHGSAGEPAPPESHFGKACRTEGSFNIAMGEYC